MLARHHRDETGLYRVGFALQGWIDLNFAKTTLGEQCSIFALGIALHIGAISDYIASGGIDNPVALHLRAMNMVFEGLRQKGSTEWMPFQVEQSPQMQLLKC